MIDDEFPPHGDPYHICVTKRAGREWRFKLPNYVVVAHECGQKPRIKWIAPLPPVPKVVFGRSSRKSVRRKITALHK